MSVVTSEQCQLNSLVLYPNKARLGCNDVQADRWALISWPQVPFCTIFPSYVKDNRTLS